MIQYGAALFLSAFLLFGVQPLMGKFALPWFGGGPAVWTACMLFFQAGLLAGYTYAHLLVTRLAPRRQAQVHLAVVAAVTAWCLVRVVWVGSAVAPSESWRDGAGSPALRVVALLAASVGPVFLLLSSSAPLMQVWFAREHPGKSPYRLYALSNAGSLTSLLAYPFLIEPWTSRRAQAWAFFAGFVLLAAGLAVLARRVAKLAAPTPVEGATGARPPERLSQVGAWLGLSFLANVLLLATTHQLSEDVAAGPFQWLLPLCLYLLTFILCFERPTLYRRGVWFTLLGLSGAMVALFWSSSVDPYWMQLTAYSAALFSGCMVCHGELYRLRPESSGLSRFYLWIAVGGVVAGSFVGLAAPRIFTSYREYPLALCGALVVAALVLVAMQSKRALAGAMALALCVGALELTWQERMGEPIWRSRNFFGVVHVHENGPKDSRDHRYLLLHGQTLHGMQFVARDRRREIFGYYTRLGGLGRAVEAKRKQAGERPLRIGVLGLGAGQVCTFARAQDVIRFYEIDPLVIDLARGAGGYFSYLGEAPGGVEVVLGDARMELERELRAGEHQRFDVLLVDTFSGDSIPAHLLTREAFAIYQAHLAPDGFLVVHVSNRHLSLEGVVATHAKALGHTAMLVNTEGKGLNMSTLWAVLAPDPALFDAEVFPPDDKRLQRMNAGQAETLWTDDHNSLLPLMHWR